MDPNIILWLALGLNALGLISAVIYNSGKAQSMSTTITGGMKEIKNSLLRMEDRAERNSNEIRLAMQSMVDKLYDLGGRVSKLEGINRRS